MYQVTRLPNGLRIATASMSHMESVSLGIWVGIGGRYEAQRVAGISHFIEHLLFKGTKRRTTKEISQAVEGLGGYLNAFTGEENTCFYAKASHRHLDTLLDVLSDMYRNPRFALADINKERQVIKEELLMYRDQPDHYVHELLTETLWPGHPLGRSLTGTVESVERLQRVDFLSFKQANYFAGNTLLVVAGHCEHEDVVARVRRALPLPVGGRMPKFKPVTDGQRSVRLRWQAKEVEQTHLAIGIRSCSRHDQRRYALKLLSVILGENMSSRLFQAVREQHGLAYSIQSSTSYLADTGAFLVSAGLDSKRVKQAVRLIMRELSKPARSGVTAGELRRAKDYAVGQMWLGLESSSNQMMWLGEHLLAYGAIHTPEEIERRIEAVTTAQVQESAREFFCDRRLNAAIITPGKDERAVGEVLRFS